MYLTNFNEIIDPGNYGTSTFRYSTLFCHFVPLQDVGMVQFQRKQSVELGREHINLIEKWTDNFPYILIYNNNIFAT